VLTKAGGSDAFSFSAASRSRASAEVHPFIDVLEMPSTPPSCNSINHSRPAINFKPLPNFPLSVMISRVAAIHDIARRCYETFTTLITAYLFTGDLSRITCPRPGNRVFANAGGDETGLDHRHGDARSAARHERKYSKRGNSRASSCCWQHNRGASASRPAYTGEAGDAVGAAFFGFSRCGPTRNACNLNRPHVVTCLLRSRIVTGSRRISPTWSCRRLQRGVSIGRLTPAGVDDCF